MKIGKNNKVSSAFIIMDYDHTKFGDAIRYLYLIHDRDNWIQQRNKLTELLYGKRVRNLIKAAKLMVRENTK